MFQSPQEKFMEDMIMINIFKKSILFIVISFLFMNYMFHISAIEADDNLNNINFQIVYKDNDKGIPNAKFELYKIAEIDVDGSYKLIGDFTNYPVNMDFSDKKGLRELAKTLISYIYANNTISIDKGYTDSNGILEFPTQNKELTEGIYLINSEKVLKDNQIYNAEPFIYFFVNEKYEDIIKPKFKKEVYNIDEKIDIEVKKIWNNDNELLRPKEITVDLIKNSEVYDSVKLNEQNGWDHKWKNLPKVEDGIINWNIVERKVQNYYVSISEENNVFILTNTYESRLETDPCNIKVIKLWNDKNSQSIRPTSITVCLLRNNEVYDEKIITNDNWSYEWKNLPKIDKAGKEIDWKVDEKEVKGYKKSIENRENVFYITNTLIKQKAPDSGQLKWPIPLLLLVGISFIACGVLLKRKEN